MSFLTIALLHLALLNPVMSSLLSTVAISRITNRTVVCGLVFHPTADYGYTINCSYISQTGKVFSSPAGIGRAFYPAAIDAGDVFLCILSDQKYRAIESSMVHLWTLPVVSDDGGTTSGSVKRIYIDEQPIGGISAGGSHVCGIIEYERNLQCWRWPRDNPPLPSLTEVTDVAVGRGFVCVLLDSGRNISCYGNDNGAGVVVSDTPTGQFRFIEAGDNHACALTVSGSLDCWGVDAPKLEDFTSGPYKSMAVGDSSICALRVNETVVCWGDDIAFSERLRDMKFLTITAKGKVFCGVEKMSFGLFCWGGDDFTAANSRVFDGVLPGPCTSSCSGTEIDIPGSSWFCPPGTSVCTGMVQPLSLPNDDGGGGDLSLSTVRLVFVIVGSVCFGGAVALILCFLFFKMYWKKNKDARISHVVESSMVPEGGISY